MEIAFRLSIFIFILNFITIYLISNNILIRINNKNRSMKYIYIYIYILFVLIIKHMKFVILTNLIVLILKNIIKPNCFKSIYNLNVEKFEKF